MHVARWLAQARAIGEELADDGLGQQVLGQAALGATARPYLASDLDSDRVT